MTAKSQKTIKLPSGFQRAIPCGSEYLGLGISSYNGRVGLSIRFLWLPKDSDTLAPSKKGIFVPYEASKLVIEHLTAIVEETDLTEVLQNIVLK